MKFRAKIIVTALLLQFATTTQAHSGKTDANDCHTEKKTGEYHCHTSQPKEAKVLARTTAPQGKSAILCSTNIHNCSDFDEHEHAQNTYEVCMKNVGFDVHDLDRDGDGIACEDLQ